MVKAHCRVTNNPKRLKRLYNQMQLASSLSEIQQGDHLSAKKKKEHETRELIDLLPDAKEHLGRKVAQTYWHGL
jgi:hypothetical protein